MERKFINYVNALGYFASVFLTQTESLNGKHSIYSSRTIKKNTGWISRSSRFVSIMLPLSTALLLENAEVRINSSTGLLMNT